MSGKDLLFRPPTALSTARKPATAHLKQPKRQDYSLNLRVCDRMDFLLWIIAVVLVVAGIVAIVRSHVLWGVVLIVVGLLVGPGGVSLLT